MSERMEIEETVALLGLYIDAKNWEELGEILSEIVELDYTSLFGGAVEQLSKLKVVSMWKSLLTLLKATQHDY